MFILLILFLGQILGMDLRWLFWMGAQACRPGQDVSRRLDARRQERRREMNNVSHRRKHCCGQTRHPVLGLFLCACMCVYIVRALTCLFLLIVYAAWFCIFAQASHSFFYSLPDMTRTWHWKQHCMLVTCWLEWVSVNYNILLLACMLHVFAAGFL